MPELLNKPQISSPTTGPNKVIAEYLAESSPAFARLEAARKEVRLRLRVSILTT